MAVITDADLNQAEAGAVQAAIQLEALEHEIAQMRTEPDEYATGRLGRAMARQRQANHRLEQMRQDRGLQDAAREAHAAAEAAADAMLDNLTIRVEESAAALRAAALTAEAAQRDLLDATLVHNANVATSARLVGETLPLVDEHGIEYETGSSKAGLVRIRSRYWTQVEPQAVFLRTAWSSSRAVLGDQHPLTTRVHDRAGLADLANRGHGVFEGLAVSDSAQLPRLPRPAPYIEPKPEQTEEAQKPFLMRQVGKLIDRG